MPSPTMSCVGSLRGTSSIRLPAFEPRTFFLGNSSPVSALICTLPFGCVRSNHVMCSARNFPAALTIGASMQGPRWMTSASFAPEA